MEKDVVIIAFSKPTSDGIILRLNKKTTLKTGNIVTDEFWVSWDKIGAALFDGYTGKDEVAELNEIRNNQQLKP